MTSRVVTKCWLEVADSALAARFHLLIAFRQRVGVRLSFSWLSLSLGQPFDVGRNRKQQRLAKKALAYLTSMKRPTPPGPQATLSFVTKQLETAEPEYERAKNDAIAAKKVWRRAKMAFVAASKARAALRRMERSSMKSLELDTSMLDADESCGPDDLDSRSSHASDPEENAESWHNGDTTDDDVDHHDDKAEFDPDLVESCSKYELRTQMRLDRTPSMAALPASMACERAFRLMRRREKLAHPSSSSRTPLPPGKLA